MSLSTASELSVTMEAESVAVREGGKLQLTCRVTGFRGPLSVTWDHMPGPASASAAAAGPPRRVVVLSQEGVVEPGQDFAQRGVRVTRPAAEEFTLELEEVRPSDEGTYGCTVSEWTAKPTGDVDKSHSQRKTCTVNVSLLGE